MLRVVLFLLTNFAVLVVFGIVLKILGIDAQSTMGLLAMAGTMGFAGSFISLLSSKKMALRSVGGEVITQPQNATEEWLVNTVRELATQDDLPMPEVAIYYADEMNAFATGASKKSSLVAVSSGLLNAMNEDEAKAVLAHEMSHIKNGDMVTMTLLQGILNTFIIFLANLISQIVATNRTENEESTTSYGTYYMVRGILESIFGVLATIIAMWFSRQREFRADAGSARLVGKEKMISALRCLDQQSNPKDINGELAAFGISGKRGSLTNLFLSHPPIAKRIEALEKLNQSQIIS